jgi:transposase
MHEQKRGEDNLKQELMNRALKFSVGIDMSKDKFDACISIIDTSSRVKIKATKSFKNNYKGFTEFKVWVENHCKEELPISHTMEATGVYYEQLALFLTSNDYYVSVLLPSKSKHYLKSLGYKSKTDKIDAKGLSRMGAEQKLDQWKPYSNSIYMLRSLTRQHENLNVQKTTFSNQLHAIEHSGYKNKIVIKQLEQIILLLDKQLIELSNEIETLIKQDPLMNEKVEKICKIKGVAYLTVATIIAETNGFVLFKNQSQLVSYAGYDVVENSSGKHIGKTRISKKGNSHIRRILHMPAILVKKYEPAFGALYKRVYEKNKVKMKGIVAVQKKLLVIIYTLWKNNTEYNQNYHKTSGNDEPKPLFSLGSEGDVKKLALVNPRAKLDELPCNESPEALFSLIQNY